MKKYISPVADGGAPLHNNRIVTELQGEIWDAMQSILKESAGVTNMIVSGCAITGGGPYNIAAGIVYVNGEFLRFAGATGVTLPYYISTAADIITQKTFADSVSRNLLVEKVAQGATVDPGGQRIAIIAGQRVPSLREYLHLKADVINALNNTTTDQALSAAQGKTLNDTLNAEITARTNGDNAKVSKAGDSMSGALTSTSTAEFNAGIRTANSGAYIKKKILDIGDWNMDSNLSPAAIPHGLSAAELDKLISVRVMIKPDAGSGAQWMPLETYGAAQTPSGKYTLDNTNVYLAHIGGINSIFDNINYDSTSFNRGKIYIEYEA